MGAPWPSDEARETYIRFLELELRLMRCAALGSTDRSVLEEFSSLLDSRFPRTRAFLDKNITADRAGAITDELRLVAWAEARAEPGGRGPRGVRGGWTEEEIAGDINECFREAVERAERERS